ncbi:Histone acetyltransferase KAT8 [Toxocara canis]|uniref:Histone acetyltransferase n=1 Tax=Toxocara canis TaxID=6265 RepID=A0A0B2VH92_TOXCA|nr:Histone acetyltransferase KAT8 [Toxocara canis]
MRSKKERAVVQTTVNDAPLTLSSELKVGESFIVLRRAPSRDGVINERCLATLVEIRSDEEAIEAASVEDDFKNECADGDEVQSNGNSDVQQVCAFIVNTVCVSGGDLSMDVDSCNDGVNCAQEKKPILRKYYVHYDGMDRRLDEWVERERIVERANPGNITPSVLAVPASLAGTLESSGTMTRSQRRIHEEFNHLQKSYEDMDATTAKLEKEHAEMTKVKNIEVIRYGIYEIDAWYVSPYPAEYGKLHKLWICEYCMAYMKSEEEYCCHMMHYCDRRQPPGDEIYRKGNLSVFEVDGRASKPYCQCLCLLSKLFLDHKTLFFDVETFLFYVLCEVDEIGAHCVGHFSKERLSANNLACIMVLPPFQRRGYGKLLIQLSAGDRASFRRLIEFYHFHYCTALYLADALIRAGAADVRRRALTIQGYELSSREGVIGTPEKPLSDLGKVSYRSYWWWVILEALDELNIDDITVSDLSVTSGIAEDDIISTLQTLQLIKYWKGDHVVRTTRRLVEHCRSVNIGRPPRLRLDPSCLRWWPRTRQVNTCHDSKLGSHHLK